MSAPPCPLCSQPMLKNRDAWKTCTCKNPECKLQAEPVSRDAVDALNALRVPPTVETPTADMIERATGVPERESRRQGAIMSTGGYDTCWPLDPAAIALLVEAYPLMLKEVKAVSAERDALQSEVGRWKHVAERNAEAALNLIEGPGEDALRAENAALKTAREQTHDICDQLSAQLYAHKRALDEALFSGDARRAAEDSDTHVWRNHIRALAAAHGVWCRDNDNGLLMCARCGADTDGAGIKTASCCLGAP